MAIEKKRGCGYRKVNGVYLVMDPGGFECDRIPLELSVCPCCGEGIKFSRGFTWIQPFKLFSGDHPAPCKCNDHMACTAPRCPVCQPSFYFVSDDASDYFKEAGLMWIGEKYYSTETFSQEANELGISKRIAAIPHGFKVGETWVFLAHKKAVKINDLFKGEPAEPRPGIFMAFKPARIEKIVLQSEFDLYQKVKLSIGERFEDLLKSDQAWQLPKEKFSGLKIDLDILRRFQRDIDRGFILIPVPDDDADHNPLADPEYLPPDEKQKVFGVDRAYDDRPIFEN